MLFGAWLALEVVTVPQNFGMAMQRVAFTASIWMIALWLEHADLGLRRVRALLAWPVMAVLAGSVLAIFLHENPFFPSELLGSFIGPRKWVALTLVAALPWFLLSARRSDHAFLLAIAFVLVANRTRTAWLIAIVYVVVLAALSVKRPRLRLALARLAATSVLAIVLVQQCSRSGSNAMERAAASRIAPASRASGSPTRGTGARTRGASRSRWCGAIRWPASAPGSSASRSASTCCSPTKRSSATRSIRGR